VTYKTRSYLGAQKGCGRIHRGKSHVKERRRHTRVGEEKSGENINVKMEATGEKVPRGGKMKENKK